MKRTTLILTLVVLGASVLSGCGKAKKTYPDPDPGWHSADYTVLFGRLQRKAAANPDDPPIWLIRYDLGKDRYHGVLALSPIEKLVGYSGGEMVEVRGKVKAESPPEGQTVTLYEVRAIRLWTGYSGQ